MSRAEWNTRAQDLQIPPWLTSSETTKAPAVNMYPIQDSNLIRSTSTLQNGLKCFAEDASSSNRYLIGTQSLFGWDQGPISDELNSLIEKVNEKTRRPGEPIQGPKTIVKLQIEVEPTNPIFALQRKPDLPEPITLDESTRARIATFFAGVLCVLLELLMFTRFKGDYDSPPEELDDDWEWVSDPNRLSGAWACSMILPLISCIAGLVLSGILSLRERHVSNRLSSEKTPSIHDSIGLAWSMKEWVRSEIPID